MNKEFFQKHLLETAVLAVSVLCNAIVWLMALFLFPEHNAAAILHYNASVGIDLIGEGAQIKVLPIIGTSFIILNVIVAYLLGRASRLAAIMFWSILPIVEALLLIAFLLILRLNS